MLKIAINGYGRIGRSFVRALAEREAAGNALPVRLVAINDPGGKNRIEPGNTD